MYKETQSIIRNLQNVLNSEPWYGRAVYKILEEITSEIVHKKPNDKSHSLIELLYHMITWAEFTLMQIKGAGKEEIEKIESRDWISIDPSAHTWQKGLIELKSIHEKIIELLQPKEDEWLKEKVNFREFNYRFLLNGLIQHNIYHIGQIAYLKKQLD